LIEAFHYRVSWRAASPHPGTHASSQNGGSDEFAGLVPFVASPNPRNLDLRASLGDPFGQLAVRRFRQRSQIPVVVIADLSASMGYRGTGDKAATVAQFVASAAWSAFRQGDRFGFIAGDEHLHEALFLPTRLYKGGVPELVERLALVARQGRSAASLRQAAQHLGRQRALVFLVSDFHFPLQEAQALLASLARHDVVPVVVWDSAEYDQLPEWGLVLVEDPETGGRRRLFMRPALKARFRQRFGERRELLSDSFRRQGRPPFFLIDRFEADAMTRYFLSGF